MPKGRLQYTCLGFAWGGKDLADKVSAEGVSSISFGEKELCLNTTKIALLPWETKLSDIPPELPGN